MIFCGEELFMVSGQLRDPGKDPPVPI